MSPNKIFVGSRKSEVNKDKNKYSLNVYSILLYAFLACSYTDQLCDFSIKRLLS